RLAGDREPIVVDLDGRARLEPRKLLQAEADGAEPDLSVRRTSCQSHAILNLQIGKRGLGSADDGLACRLVRCIAQELQSVVPQQCSPDVVLLLLDQPGTVADLANTPDRTGDLLRPAPLALVGSIARDPAVAAGETDISPAEPRLHQSLLGALLQLRLDLSEDALNVHDAEQADDQDASQKPAQGIASHA